MKRRWFDLALTLTAVMLIVSIGMGVFFLPTADFSEEENRMLADLPIPTLQNITNGSFSASVSDYLRDRIPLRLEFIRTKAYTELLLLKGENNGILFCRDGYLLDRGEYGTLDKARKNIEYYGELSARLSATNIPVTVAYIPRGIDVMSHTLPELYRGEHTDVMTLIPTGTSLLSPLKNAAESGAYVWFRTDHHWTAHGAYIAYTELADILGYIPYPRESFDVEQVSESFLGTLYSKAGCVAPIPDSIELYRYADDGEYLLTIDQNYTQKGLYFDGFLAKKDKYSVFLGGNYATLSIEKSNAPQRERLLIIKDSYTNSLAPFLARHFDLLLLDPRYFDGGDTELLKLAQESDKALILQGIDTVSN